MIYMKQRDWMTRLKSRKFLLAVFNLIFVILNEVLQAPVDRQAYLAVTGGIVAYIAGEGYVDAHK